MNFTHALTSYRPNLNKMMKRHILASLLAVFALSSCQTAHDAAVSTFRVIDTPHAYVRRKLGVEQEPQTTTTTTTQTTYSDTAGSPPQQPYPASQPYPNQPPPPPAPVQTQRRVAATAPNSTAPPRVTQSEREQIVPRDPEPTAPRNPEPTAAPRTASSNSESLPYAKPVPGKPGYVFSPYDPNGGYVDVKGYTPGQKVKDPYSGKVFLVP